MAWGLKYKKPIVPIRSHLDAELPFLLGSRQFIDFTASFDDGLARLRDHLGWLASPAGIMQTMQDRLQDAEHDLVRAVDDPSKQARIVDDIEYLKGQIALQSKVVADPQGVVRQVEEGIEERLADERKPGGEPAGGPSSHFINSPPGIAPIYYQNRTVEMQIIAGWLTDDSKRLMMVIGRGGIGKTVTVCRVLESLKHGQLPGDGGRLEIDGMIYLSAIGSRRLTAPNLFDDLRKLLTKATNQGLDPLFQDPLASTNEKMQALLDHFLDRRVVVLLDNFGKRDRPHRPHHPRPRLRAPRGPGRPAHAAPTWRQGDPDHAAMAPHDLSLVQSGRQTWIHLDGG